ncbi:hypothetical protein PISMIDRAFT_323162 [Pisolithus microcarpus 441]|uniref:Uncharacterized protein n=1 Tax=Pisolithus microcarpus 441 TaxID=765257 RepID=A0A0C9Z616_9AGAM|nr:hypothetical protein BKA83DRAFT_323162 [Pisolithus microcarpus]KIK15403.1 hypothetical protein PISMIDRAFT_323162 [Pisolithus microcarpus 441]
MYAYILRGKKYTLRFFAFVPCVHAYICTFHTHLSAGGETRKLETLITLVGLRRGSYNSLVCIVCLCVYE